jgi:metal-responsive CopG/Arc/MetJ family transcriptional regulator
MKVKTSVSLSEELLAAIDEIAGPGRSRSAVLEEAAGEWVKRRRRQEAFEEEVARLNAIVEGPEPPDVLDYSIDPIELGDPFEEVATVGAG